MMNYVVDLTEDDDIQPIFVPRNSNTISSTPNDRNSESSQETLNHVPSIGSNIPDMAPNIPTAKQPRPAKSLQTYLVGDLSLEDCGWREQSAKSLPIKLEAVSIVYIPPWGVSNNLSLEDSHLLWKHAVRNRHYFDSITAIETFIANNLHGAIPIEPPKGIEQLHSIKDVVELAQNNASSNSSADIPKQQAVRSTGSVSAAASSNCSSHASDPVEKEAEKIENKISSTEKTAASTPTTSQKKEASVNDETAKQLEKRPPKKPLNQAAEMISLPATSTKTVTTPTSTKRHSQPASPLPSSPACQTKVNPLSSASLKSLSSSQVSKAKISPQITDFFPRIDDSSAGRSRASTPASSKSKFYSGIKPSLDNKAREDDEHDSPSKSLADEMNDSAIDVDVDNSSNYSYQHHRHSTDLLIANQSSRHSSRKRSQQATLTSGIRLDAASADIYGLRKPTFGKIWDELLDRGWCVASWSECLRGLDLSLDIRKKYKIHQDLCQNAYFSPEGVRLFNEGRHQELESDKHIFSMQDNVVSYIRDEEPNLFAEICEKLDLIPPEQSATSHSSKRRKTQHSSSGRPSAGSSSSTKAAFVASIKDVPVSTAEAVTETRTRPSMNTSSIVVNTNVAPVAQAQEQKRKVEGTRQLVAAPRSIPVHLVASNKTKAAATSSIASDGDEDDSSAREKKRKVEVTKRFGLTKISVPRSMPAHLIASGITKAATSSAGEGVSSSASTAATETIAKSGTSSSITNISVPLVVSDHQTSFVSSVLVSIGSRIFIQRSLLRNLNKRKSKKSSSSSSESLWYEAEVISLNDNLATLTFPDGEQEGCVLGFRRASCFWWPADRFMKEVAKGCFKNEFIQLPVRPPVSLATTDLAPALDQASDEANMDDTEPPAAKAAEAAEVADGDLAHHDQEDMMNDEAANTSSETVESTEIDKYHEEAEAEQMYNDHDSIDYFRVDKFIDQEVEDADIDKELNLLDSKSQSADMDSADEAEDDLSEVSSDSDSVNSSERSEEEDAAVDEADLENEIKKWMPPSNPNHKLSLIDDFTMEVIAEANTIISSAGESLRVQDVWPYLTQLGWRCASSSFVHCPKFSSCYVAPWTLHLFVMDGESQRRRRLARLLEGRDYFFENEDMLRYVKRYLVHYHHQGLEKPENLSNARGRRISSSHRSFSTSRAPSREMIATVKIEKKKPRPVQLQLLREEKLLVWKQQRGHVFYKDLSSSKAITTDPFLDCRIRRFVVSKSKANFVSKRYYDGLCVSYRPSTSSKVMDEEGGSRSETIQPAEWGVIYDDISAFDHGCELLDLMEIYQAVHDYKQQSTAFSSAQWSKRHLQYLHSELPSSVSHKPSSSSSLDRGSSSTSASIAKLEAYEKKIIALDAKLRHEQQQSKKIATRLESLEAQYENQVALTTNLKASHQLDLNQLKRDHQKQLVQLRNEYDRANNENRESLRRENVLKAKQQLQQVPLKAMKAKELPGALASTSPTTSSSFSLEMKLKLWKDYLLLLLQKKKRPAAETVTAAAAASSSSIFVRELDYIPSRMDVCVLKDEHYPIQTTINIFKSQMKSG
jgi:hypothetical protein